MKQDNTIVSPRGESMKQDNTVVSPQGESMKQDNTVVSPQGETIKQNENYTKKSIYMTIAGIRLSHLHKNEHFQFIQDVITQVEEATPAALRVEEQFAALTAAHEQEEEAYRKITTSIITKKIKTADAARDKVFRSMVDIVNSMLNYFDNTTAEAARVVAIVLKTHGNLGRKAYAEETAAIYKLVQELTTNYADECTTLGLGPWLAELGRCNIVVEELMNERYDEATGRTDLVLKDVRMEVDNAYRALVRQVEAWQLVDGGEVYDSFIRKLNAVIERAASILAQRKGKKSAASSQTQLNDEL